MCETAKELRSRFHDMLQHLPPAWAAVYRQVDKVLSQYPRLSYARVNALRNLMEQRAKRCPPGLVEARRAYRAAESFLGAYATHLYFQNWRRMQRQQRRKSA